MSITTFSEKTIKFAISHSFIIFYLFNWTYSLEDSVSMAVAEKKNFHSLSLYAPLSLSLSICTRATLSLSLSFPFSLASYLLPNFAKKEKGRN
jgi:hypothetical protein